MTFYKDKKFAMKHYSCYSWISLVLGILFFGLSFIFYNYMIILILLGITFLIISIQGLSFGSYGNLTFNGKSFMIGKKEAYGDLLFTKSNTYNFTVINLNDISISNRFIILKGNFEKTKYFGKPKYAEDNLYKQNKQITTIKIPRIYEKENNLLEELNKFLSKPL